MEKFSYLDYFVALGVVFNDGGGEDVEGLQTLDDGLLIIVSASACFPALHYSILHNIFIHVESEDHEARTNL